MFVGTKYVGADCWLSFKMCACLEWPVSSLRISVVSGFGINWKLFVR